MYDSNVYVYHLMKRKYQIVATDVLCFVLYFSRTSQFIPAIGSLIMIYTKNERDAYRPGHCEEYFCIGHRYITIYSVTWFAIWFVRRGYHFKFDYASFGVMIDHFDNNYVSVSALPIGDEQITAIILIDMKNRVFYVSSRSSGSIRPMLPGTKWNVIFFQWVCGNIMPRRVVNWHVVSV